MKKTIRISVSLILCAVMLFSSVPISSESQKSKREEIESTVSLVFDYYSKNGATVDKANTGPKSSDWKGGTYLMGVLDAYIATGDEKYLNHCNNIMKSVNYRSNSHKNGRMSNYPDEIQRIQVIYALDMLEVDGVKLEHSKSLLDYCLTFCQLDYTWIDEIYMLAQSLIYQTHITGDIKYFEADFLTYKYFRELLFDFEDGLWYRDNRYIYDLENPLAKAADGRKVYWSRGNTWVYVSLIRRLEMMEKLGMTEGEYQEAYDTYLYDFTAMSYTLKDIQRNDGFWNANLSNSLDGRGKETTGTGGFLYGLAAGIRLGYLDREAFLPTVEKCYNGVVKHAVRSNGFLGYCQPVGTTSSNYNDASTKDKTNNFGVGLFLMGACEYLKIVE